MPISRVRAVTVASMMFMIPTPLTSRVIMAMPSSTRVSAEAVRLATASNCVRFSTWYTDSGRWRMRMTSWISWVARGTSPALATEKKICLTASVPVK